MSKMSKTKISTFLCFDVPGVVCGAMCLLMSVCISSIKGSLIQVFIHNNVFSSNKKGSFQTNASQILNQMLAHRLRCWPNIEPTLVKVLFDNSVYI